MQSGEIEIARSPKPYIISGPPIMQSPGAKSAPPQVTRDAARPPGPRSACDHRGYPLVGSRCGMPRSCQPSKRDRSVTSPRGFYCCGSRTRSGRSARRRQTDSMHSAREERARTSRMHGRSAKRCVGNEGLQLRISLRARRLHFSTSVARQDLPNIRATYYAKSGIEIRAPVKPYLL